jgi:hypothetical protein
MLGSQTVFVSNSTGYKFYTDGTGVLDSGAAGASETQLDGATWETTAAAGELAVIRLNTSAVTAGA